MLGRPSLPRQELLYAMEPMDNDKPLSHYKVPPVRGINQAGLRA